MSPPYNMHIISYTNILYLLIFLPHTHISYLLIFLPLFDNDAKGVYINYLHGDTKM